MCGERFKTGLRILGMGALILAQAGCVPEQTTPPNPNDGNGAGGNNLSLLGTDIHQSPLAAPESIETPTLAPQEKTPAAEHSQPAAIPVEAPSVGSLDFTGAPYSMELSPSEITDLNAADAVYAYFLSTGRKWTPSSDEAFIAGMSKWANELEKLDIRVVRAANNYGVATVLIKGDGNNQQVLLDFMNDGGVLRSATSGGWSPESTSKWINVRGKAGLVVGPDGVGYVTQMEGTDVAGYLNPYGASQDTIHSYWIPVKNGKPEKVWDGKEWVKVEPESMGWQAYEPPMTPEHIEFLDTLDLFVGSTSSGGDLLRNPELNGKAIYIGKSGYVHGMKVTDIKTDSFSGKGIYLYIDLKNGAGSYTQVPALVAVKSDNGDVGFGLAGIVGERYNEIGRNENGELISVTFEQAVEYFDGAVGTEMSIIVPVWDSKAGNNPYIPGLFAEMMAPNYGDLYPPGFAPRDMDNGLYRFVQAVCSVTLPCNMTDPSKSLRVNTYTKPDMLRELALQLPDFGLLVSDIYED